MYTIFTDVDEIDGTRDGYVLVPQFVKALKSTVGTKHLMELDFEYLSQKYRNMSESLEEDRQKVYYKFFYKDFEVLEERRLSEKIYGLSS